MDGWFINFINILFCLFLIFLILQRLYNLGARKFLVISVYPLGCSPVISRGQGCLARQNDIVSKFYDKLIPIINQIKTQLPGSDFIVLNSVRVISDIINNPITSGNSILIIFVFSVNYCYKGHQLLMKMDSLLINCLKIDRWSILTPFYFISYIWNIPYTLRNLNMLFHWTIVQIYSCGMILLNPS